MVDANLRKQVEADILARPEVKPSNMMGTTAYMVRNRMFAFWVADGLVLKLHDLARQAFLDRQQGALFQGPQARGFGEWTRLQLEEKKDVEAVLSGVKEAYEHVRGTAAAKPRAKKGRRK
jgi:hypothetical protein